MGGLFSGPDIPEPAPLPPAPAPDNNAMREAAQAEAAAIRRKRGFLSTIMTGMQGVTSPASTFKTKLGE